MKRLWYRLRYGPLWQVTLDGVVMTDKPVTWGPFVECRMLGAKFHGTTMTTRARTAERALHGVSSRLPPGLSVVEVSRWPAVEVTR